MKDSQQESHTESRTIKIFGTCVWIFSLGMIANLIRVMAENRTTSEADPFYYWFSVAWISISISLGVWNLVKLNWK